MFVGFVIVKPSASRLVKSRRNSDDVPGVTVYRMDTSDCPRPSTVTLTASVPAQPVAYLAVALVPNPRPRCHPAANPDTVCVSVQSRSPLGVNPTPVID